MWATIELWKNCVRNVLTFSGRLWHSTLPIQYSVANEPSWNEPGQSLRLNEPSRVEPMSRLGSGLGEPGLMGSIKRNEVSMLVSAQKSRNYKRKLDCETRRWIRDPYNWRIILIVTEIVRYVVDKNLQNVFIWSNLRIATHDDELIHDSENDKVVYIYYWQLKLWTKKELSLINKWKKTELRFKITLIIAMMILNLLCRFLFQSSKSNQTFYRHHHRHYLWLLHGPEITELYFYTLRYRASRAEPSLVFLSSNRAEPRVGLGLVDLWLGSARWQHCSSPSRTGSLKCIW